MVQKVGDVNVLETLQERETTYSFLSQVYSHELSREQLAQLICALAEGDVDQDAAGEGHRLLHQFASQVQDLDLEKVSKDLGAEYIRVFYGSMFEGVYPYESVHTSPEGVMMQEAHNQVLRLYQEEGLKRDPASKEPEDHIAFELEFMAYLCRKATDALDTDPVAAHGYLEKQKTFLNGHLVRWVPKFCEQLAQGTRSDFYRGIALMTREHLAMECDTVDELIEAVQANGGG